MNQPKISVIIPCHSETTWLRRAIRSVRKQIESPDTEILLVADKASPETYSEIAAAAEGIAYIEVNYGDLGLSRNAGVRAARGEYVAFLDADDIFGCTWLRSAYEFAKTHPGILHPEWSVMFGAVSFVHHHISSTDPSFDPRDMVQFNQWSALAFAPRSVFEKYPYEEATDRFGFEDWHFNALTLGEGVPHHCVPGTAHMIRMKLDKSSLAARTTETTVTLGPRGLFDQRDLRRAEYIMQPKIPDNEVHKQILFAHHEVGEYQLLIGGQTEVRHYPRQKAFDDQAFLRDEIGSAKHVVLVNELVRGGAEKYAIDVAGAIGKDVVIIETKPGESPWLTMASKACKVVQWRYRNELQPAEASLALRRALIQADLDSVWLCNSELGWLLYHENTTSLARAAVAFSFATIPVDGGFVSCPPFHMRRLQKNLRLATDNKRHASRMRDYLGVDVSVVPPKCEYSGHSKLRQFKTDKVRVLWAGRGTPEKRPELVPAIASISPFAEFHVWGDVPRANHSLKNLHYRGRFDGFESIEGSYDCYLLTSMSEGMPHTAMEAVIAGLPIISTDVGDLSEIATVIEGTHNASRVCELISSALKNPIAKLGSLDFVVKSKREFKENIAGLIK